MHEMCIKIENFLAHDVYQKPAYSNEKSISFNRDSQFLKDKA